MSPGIDFSLGACLGFMAKLDFDTASGEPLAEQFGPYRLVRRLGVGGMAETFEAIRQGPSGFTQRVCLKLVLPFFRDDEEFVRLFEREARLAAKLRHSNIVGVIDFGEIAGRSYMALELVDGVDLQVLLESQDGKRLSHEYVALLGHELACALEHAHNPPPESDFDGSQVNTIVHRDISPSNVLISRHGEILLTDFGVAKAVTGSSRKQSAVKGKIPYMSPEQLRAEQIDGRADLFGVGVVLFEALAGRRPFEGAHDPATIMQILEGEYPSLCSLAPGAPTGLCQIVESLIAPRRDERPADAASLIDLLDPFVPSPRVRRRLAKMVIELRPERDSASSGYPPARGDAATELHDDEQQTEREKRTSGIVGAGERRARMEAELGSLGPAARESVAEIAPAPRRRRGARLLAGSLMVVTLLAAGGAALWSTAGGFDATSPESPNIEPVTASDGVLQKPTQIEDDPQGLNTRTHESESEALHAAPKAAVEPSESVRPERTETQAQEPRAPPAATRPSSTTPSPANLTVVVFPWGNVWINGKARGAAPVKNASLKPGRYRISVGRGSPSKTETIRLRPGQHKMLEFDLTN